jgi:hypothetical protein
MPVVFRHFAVPIPKAVGNRFSEHHITFPASQVVRNASIALTGFRLDFENPEGDRSLNVMAVLLNRGSVTPTAVDFNLTVQLADKNFDDEYQGVVGILMIADVRNVPSVVSSRPKLAQLLGRFAARSQRRDLTYKLEQGDAQGSE